MRMRQDKQETRFEQTLLLLQAEKVRAFQPFKQGQHSS